MMKFLFCLFMMIPLSFFLDFWFIQLVWMLVSFFFLLYFALDGGVMYLSMDLGVDLLLYVLVLLSFWICSLKVLASEKVYFSNNWFGLFLFVVLLLMISLYLTFSSLNLFIFYLFLSLVLFLLLFWLLVGVISLSVYSQEFIYFFMLCWLLCL